MKEDARGVTAGAGERLAQEDTAMSPRATLLLTAALLLPSPAFAEFVRPHKADSPLIYGVKNGIFVAIHPAALDGRGDGGPRGLIRVGYEEGGKRYLINYIAVEPVVGGNMGFSELEKGGDGKPGKRFWVGAGPADGGVGKDGNRAGRIQNGPDGRVLSFFLHVEPFANGARPVVEVSLFEKQPTRIRLRTFSGPGGKAMQRCALTATMGNQSRCRHLWLAKGAAFAPALFAGYTGTDFVEKRPHGLAELFQTKAGDVVAAISPDEFEPREAWPFPNSAWHHDGRWMAQFWLKRKGTFDKSLQCRVNGRRVYWAGKMPIPGGLSYENFEFREPFRAGQELWFGYTTDSPAKTFGFPYDVSPRAAPRRAVPKEEAAAAAEAAKASRPLTNGNFTAGLKGWRAEGGAGEFRTFALGKAMALTTFGKNKDADTGRLYQCFRVPATATELQFTLHGGADARKTYVALWEGTRLHRRMTARDDNTPFRVRWDVVPLRGKVVTLEIVDKSTAPWGFIGVGGFTLASRR
jgi:hypothetical protein